VESRILLRNILQRYALKIYKTKKRSSELGAFFFIDLFVGRAGFCCATSFSATL
jgi:hypothetical protein